MELTDEQDSPVGWQTMLSGRDVALRVNGVRVAKAKLRRGGWRKISLRILIMLLRSGAVRIAQDSCDEG